MPGRTSDDPSAPVNPVTTSTSTSALGTLPAGAFELITWQSRFAAAIAELELDQLHTEASRLKNSLYHLERSNVQLEEFRDDPDCIEALRENARTAERQLQRVRLIEAEIEKRGFPVECSAPDVEMASGADGAGGADGVGNGHASANGSAPADGEEDGDGVYL